jgi:ClpP class serine protease
LGKKNNVKIIEIIDDKSSQSNNLLCSKNKAIYEFSKIKYGDSVDIILHTGGGVGTIASYCIDRIVEIKKNGGKVRMFVPFYACSAGSMLALGGHELYMNSYSVLTPFDSQINNAPASTYERVLEYKGTRASDSTIISTDIARKDAFRSDETFNKIVSRYVPETIDMIRHHMFINENNQHSRLFTVSELNKFGIIINGTCPDEITDIVIKKSKMELS